MDWIENPLKTMGKPWENGGLPFVIKHGWLENLQIINGGSDRKVTNLNGPFSIAMVDYRMTAWYLVVGHWLASLMWLNHKQPMCEWLTWLTPITDGEFGDGLVMFYQHYPN